MNNMMKVSPALLAVFLAAFPTNAVSQEMEDNAPLQALSAVPPTLVVPQGVILTVQVREHVSSDRNNRGDAFLATVVQPLVLDGWVIARPGQSVVGRVVEAIPAGRNRGVSQLSLELAELVLVDGQQLPVRTSLIESYGRDGRWNDAGAIAVSTGIGGAIGAGVDGGRGAALGAAIGAVAAIAGVLSTRGAPTEVLSDTILTFRLESPLAVSTVRSQQAFAAVTAADYQTAAAQFRLPDPEPVRETRTVFVDSGWRHYGPTVVIRPRRYFSRPRVYVPAPRVYIAPRIVIGRGWARSYDRGWSDRGRFDRDRGRDWNDRRDRDGRRDRSERRDERGRGRRR